MRRIILFIGFVLVGFVGLGQTLLDNYDGTGDLTYSTEGTWVITGGQYEGQTGGVTTPEHSYASYDLSSVISGWDLQDSKANCWFGWMDLNRTTASGWGATNYSCGLVLAANASDFNAATTVGYAIGFNSSGALVVFKFTTGIVSGTTALPGTSTSIVTSGYTYADANNGVNFYVELLSDGKWKVYYLAGAKLSDANATNKANYTGGNATSASAESSYRGTTYKYSGWIYSHSTGASDKAYFDNFGAGQTSATPSITLADNGTQITAANVNQGTANHVLHKSSLAVTTANATLTGMTCTTNGTYISADVTNLKAWYSTDNTFSSGSDVLLSTLTTPGVAGNKTFPSFSSQVINSGSTAYIFITADIAAGATAGNTIYLNALTTSDFTFSSGSKSGSTTDGGAQTFVALTPSITLSSPNPAVAAANITQGSTKNAIYYFTTAVTTANATLNSVAFTTTNTAAADITKYQLWYYTSNDLASASQIGSDITSSLGTGIHTFSSLSQVINSGSTGYFWITTDVAVAATIGNTIVVSAITTSDLTFASGSKSGTAYAGGTQTVTALSYCASDLIFSSYIEGSSYNKYIEIYNGTGSSVNLDNYTLRHYNNGSATPTYTLALTGTLANNDVYVIEHSSEALGVSADLSTAASFITFNGDDALAIYNEVTAANVDIIGQIGTDPGTEWGSGLTSTADNTLVRKNTVFTGDNDGSNAFDPSVQWDGYATDVVSYLGSHTIDCAVDPEPADYPTLFTCGTTTESTIPLTWTDASTTQTPSGYLIKWSTVSYAAITAPSDGTPESDGTTTKNIAQGTQAYTPSGLSSTTTYYFKIWSYTNSGSNINYKTSATEPQTSCSTTSANVCGMQEFNGGTTPPSGWTFTSIGGTYITSSNYGTTSPSLKMDATNDAVETPTVSNPTSLSFWIKGQSTNNGCYLLVEGYNGSWNTIENINPLPTTGTTYGYGGVSGYTKFRFTYTQGSGNLAFDDVYINCSGGGGSGVWLIDEEFTTTASASNIPSSTDGFAATSGTWITAATTVYNRNANALKLGADGILTTPMFENGDLLCFWMQSLSGGNSDLTIEKSTDGINWSTLATETNIVQHPRYYFYALTTDIIQLRFNFDHTSDDVYFDDVMVRNGGSKAVGPLIERVLVNSCAGDEGINEIVMIQVGSVDINMSDLIVTFPSVTAGGFSFGVPCTKSITNNWIYTGYLNTEAGCSVISEPSGGIIPANSKLLIFTGAAPTYTYNFAGACTDGYDYYVIYCNNSETSGRFKNDPEAGTSRYVSVIDMGSGKYDQVYYDSSIPLIEGETAFYDLATHARTYGAVNCEAFLPVELLYLDAKCENGSNEISWATASETNNDYFTIEKSSDLKDWQYVTTVDGAGYSNSILSYSFIDENSLDKKYYYRLKQIDYDGKFEYFDPVAVSCDDKNSNYISLYPNPANEQVICSVYSSEETYAFVEISNYLGQKILDKTITIEKGYSNIPFDISLLQNGIYIVTVHSANGKIIERKQLVVQ